MNPNIIAVLAPHIILPKRSKPYLVVPRICSALG